MALAAGPLHAQCTPDWLPGDGVPGIYGTISAAVEWDADGPGGNDPVLVVGGSFTLADSTFVSNVAMWNGASWSAMGDGFNNTVNSLTLYNGSVVAGGSFTASGATTLGRIARWNGTGWVRFNTGTTVDLTNTVNAVIQASNGDLIAGGSFTTAGDNGTSTVTVNRLARWNGTAWGPVNPSGAVKGVASTVNALANAANSDLLVGGAFTTAGTATTGSVTVNRICRWAWNGADWVVSAIGTGANSTVSVIAAEANGDFVIGGNFTSSPATRVARWDESAGMWTALGNGMDQGVTALAVLPGGEIYAGGSFFTAGTGLARSLAYWDGSAWSPAWPADASPDRVVRSLLRLSNGSVFVGGSFTNVSNEVAANGAVVYDGGTWTPLTNGSASTTSPVTAMTTLSNGDVVVGGGFQTIQGSAAHFVARWNGSAWSTIGSGLFNSNGTYPIAQVKQPITSLIEMSNGDIVAAGIDLATSDGGAQLVMARWNGSTWSGFSPALTPAPSPLAAFGLPNIGYITALTPLTGGSLLASGGDFLIGGIPATLARWDPTTPEWVDAGLTEKSLVMATVPMNGNPGQGNVIIGGSFENIAGGADNDFIAWATQASVLADVPVWQPLGKGVEDDVSAILVLPNGDLIVGGQFSAVGNAAEDDLSANGVARWSWATSTWSRMGSGLVTGFESVNALAVLSTGEIIAGGNFDGNVSIAGEAATPLVNNLAIWDGTSWQPMGAGVNGVVYSLAVDENDNVLVGGDFTTAGGNVSAYIARWGCEAVACAADFNGVNGVTVQDIFDFLTAWLAGSPSADFNHVNGVTVQDIFDFLTAWLAGC